MIFVEKILAVESTTTSLFILGRNHTNAIFVVNSSHFLVLSRAIRLFILNTNFINVISVERRLHVLVI